MKGDQLLHRHYPEARFGGFSDVDGTVAFYSRVQALMTPENVVLDVGCGRGSGLQDDAVPWRRELRSNAVNLNNKNNRMILLK